MTWTLIKVKNNYSNEQQMETLLLKRIQDFYFYFFGFISLLIHIKFKFIINK